MAGSNSIRISEYPKLIDKSYKFAMQEYAATEVVYPMIYNTAPPPGFDVSQSLYRGVVGVFDSHVNRDWRPGQNKDFSGGFQDYHYQIRKKYLQTALDLNDEEKAITAGNLWNVVSEWAKETAISHRRELDKIAAEAINNGALTAGHSVFNNNAPSSDGTLDAPYSLFIYDGLPWFDTVHPQSIKDTTTTYGNHNSALTLSRANIQTVYTTMSTTNNRDRNGEVITIRPNTLIFNPANTFAVGQYLDSPVTNSDMQVNVLMKKGLQPLEWDLFTDSDGFVMSVAKKGKYLFPWGAPYMKAWYDEEKETSFMSLVTPYGIGISDWRFDYAAGIAAS